MSEGQEVGPTHADIISSVKMNRYWLSGVCAVGAFLVVRFETALNQFEQSLIAMLAKMDTITASVVRQEAKQEAQDSRIDRLDRDGSRALRDHERDLRNGMTREDRQ